MDDLTGRVGLVSGGKSFWSRATCAVTRSPYHHVVPIIDSQRCMSAEVGGALIRPLSHFAGQLEILDYPATDEQRLIIAQAALALDGTTYNRASFVLAGLHALGDNTPRWVSKWATKYGMDCVMLTCAAYAAASIQLVADPVTASPADMAKLGTLTPAMI